MKSLQNILAAVDLGETSNHVADTSLYLAKKFNSQISLMHVVTEDALSNDFKKIIEASVESKLQEIAERIRAKGGVVKKIIIEKGVPFEKLIQEGQEGDYNVMVVGSGNKPSGESFRLGTTVEKLMRKNQIPLWVVKKKEHKKVRKILCPVDFSDSSKRALNNAINLAVRFQATLTVLNVYEPVHIFSSWFKVDNEKENAELKSSQADDFQSFLKQFNFEDLKVQLETRDGEPFQEILGYIKENDVDLLLMGTTGKTGLSRLLMGSVTEKVTRELPCSFITTKAIDITNSYFESNLRLVESILNTARVYYKQGEYDKAIDKYLIALKQYPDNIPVITGLIESYKAIGNTLKVRHYTEYAKEVVERIWGEGYLDKFDFN